MTEIALTIGLGVAVAIGWWLWEVGRMRASVRKAAHRFPPTQVDPRE